MLTVGLVDIKTPKNVELAEVVLYDNSPEGKDTKYSMTGYSDTMEKIKDLDLKPGDKVKLSGDVEILTYMDKNAKEEKTTLQGKIYELDLVERAKEKNTNTEASKETEKKEEKEKPTEKAAKKASGKKTAADKEM